MTPSLFTHPLSIFVFGPLVIGQLSQSEDDT